MTLDTPHAPITKLLKKCPNNAGKIKGKIIFSSLIRKLDSNSGLHSKNQREIREIEIEKKGMGNEKYIFTSK